MSLLSNVDATTDTVSYATSMGLRISRTQTPLSMDFPVPFLLNKLDDHKGALFSSTYEFPGRYSRWDIGFFNPPIEMTASRRTFRIKALNARGNVLIHYLAEHLDDRAFVFHSAAPDCLEGTIQSEDYTVLKEEDRTKQPSIFTLLRQIQRLFRTDDAFLGLYGAFGFDLIHQFEQLPLYKKRDKNHTDLQLYLPDELFIVDQQKKQAYRLSYEFAVGDKVTEGLPRDGAVVPYRSSSGQGEESPESFASRKGEYADIVREAKKAFKKGDLFEVVPSRILSQPCTIPPSEVFQNLRRINPSPYGFLIHLNDREFLVGCSPEMYVRVENGVVETCPISGTIKRRGSVIEDAEQIKTLLSSDKEESELTMCTDVDRNDKSRVCVPGSVKVIGRRQIETYSHLFHTVDHIKGDLKEGFDAFDAFMTHMWAVTVTGAPKLEAMTWIEKHEKTPRRWYGGAVGWFGFNGNLNTGLTLRTMRIHKGTAEIRVGATLLYDSVPENEEQETLTKAGALMEALKPYRPAEETAAMPTAAGKKPKAVRRVLLIDHQDSFVHTLASYFQSLGAEVSVCRSPYARQLIKEGAENVDLVILSPGPGEPSRFRMDETIRLCVEHHIPVFGICLGLQGIVEYFGGQLNLLPAPTHGKKSTVIHDGRSALFKNVPETFRAGRYHSIFAEHLPDDLVVTARSDDGVIMAIEHRRLPIAAVQFHPESIMTMEGNNGMQMLDNVLDMFNK